MSHKRVLVRLVITLIATGAEQHVWARLPQKAPVLAPKAGQPVDFQANTRDHDGDNPYGIITSQNAFHLVPAPPPPAPVPPPDPAAQATIKLTGLVQVAGQQPRAMFVSTPKDPKDTAYYNLSEGERQDTLELVKILESQEAAEVISAGTHMTIHLKDSKPIVANVAPVAGGPPSVPEGTSSNLGGVANVDGALPMRQLRGTSGNQHGQPQTIDEAHILMAADAMLHQDEISAGKYPPMLPSVRQILETDDTDNGEPSSQMPAFPSIPTPTRRRIGN